MKPIRNILLQYRAKGILEPKEIASLLDCSRRRINKVLEGEANLWDWEIRRVSQYYSEMGYNQIAYLFVSTRYSIQLRGSGTVNGTHLDEMRDLLKEMDECDDHIQDRNLDEALKDVDQMRNVIDRYEAEIKAMRG